MMILKERERKREKKKTSSFDSKCEADFKRQWKVSFQVLSLQSFFYDLKADA